MHTMIPICIIVLTPSSEWTLTMAARVCVILLTHANAMSDMAVSIAPPMMKGLLRPQRIRELSAMAPTMG